MSTPKSVEIELNNKTVVTLQEGDSYSIGISLGDLSKLYTKCTLERIVPKNHNLTPAEAIKYYGKDGVIERGDLLLDRDIDLYMFRREGGGYVTIPISCDRKLKTNTIIIKRSI